MNFRRYDMTLLVTSLKSKKIQVMDLHHDLDFSNAYIFFKASSIFVSPLMRSKDFLYVACASKEA